MYFIANEHTSHLMVSDCYTGNVYFIGNRSFGMPWKKSMSSREHFTAAMFFYIYGAYEQTYRLIVRDYRRPGTPATPETT